jgi:hypothetical protein
MKNTIPTLLSLAITLGCGASDESPDFETRDQDLISDNNFGVVAGSLRQCNPGVTGQCHYPPGFGSGSDPYRWDVCPIASGMNQGQTQRATAAQQTVMSALRAGGADIGFGCPASGATPEIQIFKGPAAGLSCGSFCSTLNIRSYVTAFCTVNQPLSESPSIPGQHGYCYRWNVEVDFDKLDAQFLGTTARANAYEHAIGAVLSAAAIGSGLHGVATFSQYWSFDGGVSSPKHSLHPADFCRAAADYEGIDFFFIRKQDNSCD